MAHIVLVSPLPDDEPSLVRQAQRNPADFAPIYERYVGRIYGYCLRHLGDPTEAEDLTSLIFTGALRGLRGYRGGSVQAWLFRIAHNALMTHFRQKRRTPPLTHTLDRTEAPQENVLTTLIKAEQHTRLAALVARLPLEQRELLVLRVDGELSAKEIGVIIGKREGAVRVALHRILAGLRSELSSGETSDEDT